MVFYINGRPILKSTCDYSVDCPLVQYVKREKFLCNLDQDDEKQTTVNLTVFNMDTVGSNLWAIHNNHKKQLAQQGQALEMGK
jgi:hypothetical protein